MPMATALIVKLCFELPELGWMDSPGCLYYPGVHGLQATAEPGGKDVEG